MKKVFALLLAGLMCFALVSCKDEPSAGTNTESLGSDGGAVSDGASGDYFLWNEFDENSIVGLTDLGKEQAVLVIPANCTSIEGLSGNQTLKKVSFANPDTEILSVAFNECTALEEVQLPANLKKVEYAAFYGCSSLKSIVIPSQVTEVSMDAFALCSSLESVTFEGPTAVLGKKAFYQCSALKSIAIPQEVTTIEYSTFEECTALESVTFNSKLASVGDYAFKDCDALKKVELPDSVVSLGVSSFAHCDALEEVYLPSGISSMAANSLVPIRNMKVHLTKDSYADGWLNQMIGAEYMEKVYN